MEDISKLTSFRAPVKNNINNNINNPTDKTYVIIGEELKNFIKEYQIADLDIIYRPSSTEPRMFNLILNNQELGLFKEGTEVTIKDAYPETPGIKAVIITPNKYTVNDILSNELEYLVATKTNTVELTVDEPASCQYFNADGQLISLIDKLPNLEFTLAKLSENTKTESAAIEAWYNLSVDDRIKMIQVYQSIFCRENSKLIDSLYSSLQLDLNTVNVPVFTKHFYGFVFKMIMTNKDVKALVQTQAS